MSDLTFYSAILAGINRCNTIAFLSTYWGRWSSEVKTHARRDEIVAARDTRKVELTERARIETERCLERERFYPSRSSKV